MKTTITIVKSVLLFIVILLPNTALCDDLVTSRYDPINDWFVFEWENEYIGHRVAVLDTPNKIEPLIYSTVEYEPVTGEYIYHYSISNAESKQILYAISLDYSTSITNEASPSSDWYVMSRYRDTNQIRWAKTTNEPYGIPVGEYADGFIFASLGPPTIIDAYFWGRPREELSIPGDTDSPEVTEAFEAAYLQFKSQYKDMFKTKTKKTLAPGPMPDTANPTTFMDNLISMTSEAEKLGWIKNAGIARSLQAKLDAARKKFASGNNGAAANILKALINEADAQACESHDLCKQGQHLTPETHALIKYNAQYLLDHVK